MKLIRNIAIIIAVALIFGAVGTCDLNRITFAQALWQIAIGFVFVFVAWFCHRVIVYRSIVQKRKKARKSNTQQKERRYYA